MQGVPTAPRQRGWDGRAARGSRRGPPRPPEPSTWGLAGGVPWEQKRCLALSPDEAGACGPRRPCVSGSLPGSGACVEAEETRLQSPCPRPRGFPSEGAGPHPAASQAALGGRQAPEEGAPSPGLQLPAPRPQHPPPLPVSVSGSLAPLSPAFRALCPCHPPPWAQPTRGTPKRSPNCFAWSHRPGPTSSILCRWFAGCLLQGAPRDACSHPGDSSQ